MGLQIWVICQGTSLVSDTLPTVFIYSPIRLALAPHIQHVASNAHTRFRPNPTPHQLSNSPELQSRCQMFVRRELRVWPNLDVEVR